MKIKPIHKTIPFQNKRQSWTKTVETNWSKLSEFDKMFINRLVEDGYSMKAIARYYGKPVEQIREVLK